MAAADIRRLVRQLIADDRTSAAGIIADDGTGNEPMVLVMAALTHPFEDGLLAQALRIASSTQDRQVIAIASAFLAGETGRVDALAREHLVDYPGSVLVAWLAACATQPCAETRRPTHPLHEQQEES